MSRIVLMAETGADIPPEQANRYLVATKKLWGRLDKLAPKLVEDYAAENQLKKGELWLIWPSGFPEELRDPVEQSAKTCGFYQINWIKTGGVITTHGGSGTFGVVEFSER